MTITTTTDKYEQLLIAIRNAVTAAHAYANTEDGGACNMDTVAIDYRAMHMTKSRVVTIISAAGLHGYDACIHGTNCMLVDGISHGQGNRNTRMAQTATHSLQADGIAAMMYYQID